MGRRDLGRVFNEVPELYDRVRPGYPDALFADLASITGLGERSSVLEVGCGTGQATVPLAAPGRSVTAVEPGANMAALARRRTAALGGVAVETSTFEEWDDRGRRFDVLVAASSWHWVDPSIGWPKAHHLLRPGGWLALLGNVVVRRPGEPEVYAETADLHERFAPGNPDWGHPPLEADVRTTGEGWGLVEDPGDLFGPTVVRWYPTVQWFDGAGFADLLRSLSPYRRLDREVREPLLAAIADRIRTRLGDRVARRYLTVLRAGQRTDRVGGTVDRARALGRELVRVHRWLRDELDRLRDELDGYQVWDGPLHAHCTAFCDALTRHHTGEDTTAFPTLAARLPALAPVLEELGQDHRLVEDILRRLRQLLTTVGPDTVEPVRREIDGLRAILESHFRWEERKLVDALDALDTTRTADQMFGGGQ
jgi:SAM-dependent methyltransferase